MLASGLLVGVALGAIMQRGRFCVTGMMRDVFLQKKGRGLVALFIVISVHAVGLAALTSLGVIAPDYRTFQPAAVIVGGFIFGLSIVLAGGCASGTWYRSAEGLVGSWFALIFYGLSAAAMKNGVLHPFETWMRQWDTGWTTLPQTFGISAWWFAIALSLATAWAAHHYLTEDAVRPKVSLQQPWYKKALHPYTAGALIGLLGVIAWPLSAATGRNDGLGITTPTAHTVSYVTTADPKFLNWGTLLVLGLLVGAFIAAKASGEFRVRVPDATTTVRSIVGGVGMGVGAALAGGCTVGNGMVQTSLFSYQGWVALGFIAFGVYVGSKIWLKPSAVAAPTAAGTYSTEDSIHSAEDAVLTTSSAGGFQVATGLITVPAAQKKVTKARPVGPGRYKLDTLGAVCPFPLIEAKDAISELDDGEKLVIDFDCTQATESIPQWAADNGHAVEGFVQNRDAGWEITVVKNAAR
ncbi:YeeE/YedE thiosulfate transporter family protein [Corynebacterium qintianiae]|uniref:YeeE/YedE thiosulfate transporter family protein n=1 Tax=Corynebacterium qintianiae TaxID=2709392 RepID=UPI0013EE0C96|nr:YeeE/YedE thiosulfate transporter family protein [Corynebacterium qintianiae]